MTQIGHKDGFDLFRCADCRTVVVNPYPSDEELAKFYKNYFMTDNYQSKKESKIRRGLGRVKRMLRSRPPGKKFLDVGCSIGCVVEAAERLGLAATGIDLDPDAIDAARQRVGAACSFEATPIQALAARGISAVSTVMNPGAILYLTAPDGGHFAVPKNFTSWNMVTPPNHLTYFTRDGITRLLKRHGLQTEKFQIAIKPGLKVFARKG
jgi:SAM-dependent methyltransferase